MHLICPLLAAPTLPHYCQEKQFHCTSGECIPIRFVCDGDSDCKDHSDELQEQCRFRGEFNKWEKRCKMGKRRITKDSFFLRFLSATTSNVASSSFTNEFCSNPQFQTLTKGSPWKLTKKNVDFPGQQLLNETLLDAIFLFSQHVCTSMCVCWCVCADAWSKVKEYWIRSIGPGIWVEWMDTAVRPALRALTHSL